MNKINLNRVDLNLLITFDVLMQERSVSRAAERLGRTQSAVSHALARLRVQLDDPLLVKVGANMQPSPFALELITQLQPILLSIERVLQPSSAFDVASSRRIFRIALPDIAQNLFPRLLSTMRAQAPQIGLEWIPMTSEHLPIAITEGHIDLCLASEYAKMPADMSMQVIGSMERACFMRQDHPVNQQVWSTQTWQSYAHVLVRVSDSTQNPISETSQQLGLQRTIAAYVPHFGAVAPLLAQTDLIATMPKMVLQPLMLAHRLQMRPLPFAMPNIGQRLYWAKRLDKDPAHQWLRQHVLATYDDLLRQAHAPNMSVF
ncbi:MAG: LysR family transcriptional regulator [Formosimonas sp.]